MNKKQIYNKRTLLIKSSNIENVLNEQQKGETFITALGKNKRKRYHFVKGNHCFVKGNQLLSRMENEREFSYIRDFPEFSQCSAY